MGRPQRSLEEAVAVFGFHEEPDVEVAQRVGSYC